MLEGRPLTASLKAGKSGALGFLEQGSVRVDCGVYAHSQGDRPRVVGDIVGACYRTRIVELCWDEGRWHLWDGLTGLSPKPEGEEKSEAKENRASCTWGYEGRHGS